MKRSLIITCMAIAGIVVYSCSQNKTTPSDTAEISNDSLVRRGEYLVNAIGCGDCHTPKRMGANGPEPDPALALSGHPANQPLPPVDTAAAKNWLLFNQSLTAAVGPWGISYAANITSDVSGIGTWTEEQFFKALREGKSRGMDNARMLLPPMPWQNFAKLSDTDIKSIFYYLKSTKAVSNNVPAPVPPQDVPHL